MVKVWFLVREMVLEKKALIVQLLSSTTVKLWSVTKYAPDGLRTEV